MIFKGGSSIRKIFFPSTWRFSEDLDFTILPDTSPETITSGFEQICDLLEYESGIKYESKINVPSSGKAMLGFVQFTGPIGMKNRIKIDVSRIEKMADCVTRLTVTPSYADLEDFTVSGYTLNEVMAEKIRSTM